MPLLASHDVLAAVTSAESFGPDYAASLLGVDYFDNDAIRSKIDEIRVGTTVYPLRRAVEATYIPVKGEYLVEGFSPTFVGHGTTPEAAFIDWRDAVHSAFQELINKRPFELTEQEHRRWKVLSDQIDVTVYRNSSLIQVRQFGCVLRARPYPQEIQWENGTKERVSIEQVNSSDFVTFRVGQPFEAVVARDPVSFALLSIVHIERRSRPSRLKTAEEESLLGEIGSRSALQEVEWD